MQKQDNQRGYEALCQQMAMINKNKIESQFNGTEENSSQWGNYPKIQWRLKNQHCRLPRLLWIQWKPQKTW